MKRLIPAAALALVATPAFAHHPLAGMPMETFAHGVLSGIGHPLLGFDHLFFVILVGIAALFTGRLLIAPLGYVGGMLIGCLFSGFGVALPFAEVMVGLSLLALGYIVLSGRALEIVPALAIFAGFGLFHGSAFGGSIVGVEGTSFASVMIGYLIGLAALQYAIAVAAGIAMERGFKAANAAAIPARIAGAAVAGMGLFLSMENAEGPLLSALGLG